MSTVYVAVSARIVVGDGIRPGVGPSGLRGFAVGIGCLRDPRWREFSQSLGREELVGHVSLVWTGDGPVERPFVRYYRVFAVPGRKCAPWVAMPTADDPVLLIQGLERQGVTLRMRVPALRAFSHTDAFYADIFQA